jgi:hypothetical protein
VAAHARRTDRLDGALLLVAFELGGRAGARLAVQRGFGSVSIVAAAQEEGGGEKMTKKCW